MDDNKTILLSRWLIFLSAFIALTIEFYTELLTELYPSLPVFGSQSSLLTVVGISISIFFVAGMFLGSRGLGQPLSVSLFFKLLFSSPSKFILIPYLISGILAFLYMETTH